MKNFVGLILFIIIFITFNNDKAFAKSQEPKDLKECVLTTNCFTEDLQVNNLNDSFEKVAIIIENLPRTTILKKSKTYIHAEVSSRLMHFIDDLEVKGIPKDNVIKMRSESRLGFIDMGVNRKRIKKLSNHLKMVKQSL